MTFSNVGIPHENFEYGGKRWTKFPARAYRNHIMGVDPAQTIDHSAICIMEHTVTPIVDDWDPRHDTGRLVQNYIERFDVIDLKRLPQGMLYPDQVTHIQHALARMPYKCDLAIDDTNFAIGDECEKRGMKPIRITFTGGAEVTRIRHRKFGVPKSIIVGNVDARLHSGELKFAKDLRESDVLKDELANIQRHVSEASRSFLYAARSGRHDDTVFAIGCALWWAIRARQNNKPIYGPTIGPY